LFWAIWQAWLQLLDKVLSAILFKKLLACNPFEKRLDRKPQAVFGFEKLIP
jgi:hypothetical protein